ncbi:hypothetical protein BXZ70DRAFT_132766 [Cristinia sonorae]|uniref:BTB domain-containing protein n=1 Tax=Cristinia sonorae TaxID=1940300 RepID=A0A8K0XQN8_9AGAR|nr:hypothetical protein BXZ70DRAFT_132766 [Cristinia sonorae]
MSPKSNPNASTTLPTQSKQSEFSLVEVDTGSSPAIDDIPHTKASGLIKSTEVWYADGDIILRGDSTLFRVSRRLLTKNSRIFEDLFDIPQPDVGCLSEDSDDVMEGCLVIQVFDPPDHLEGFLKGLYDASWEINVNTNHNLRLAVGVLEVSSKYEAYPLRERVISWLASVYPPTISAYRKRWETWSKNPSERYFDPRNITLVANAARVSQALALLPAALLHYLEKFGSDFSAIIDAHDAGLALGSDRYEADLPLLTRDNLSSILKARSRIAFFARRDIYGFAFYRFRKAMCPRGEEEECLRGKREWVDEVEKGSPDGWFSPLVGQELWEMEMCSVCEKAAEENVELKLQMLWERLPGMLDLLRWDELERTSRLEAPPDSGPE